MNVKSKWYCQHTAAGHNKHYFVAIAEDRSQLKVLCAWGRIGNTLGMKETHCQFMMEAEALAAKIIAERTGKGYSVKQVDRLSGHEIQEYRKLKAPDWFIQTGTFAPPPAGVPATKQPTSKLMEVLEAEARAKRAPRKPKAPATKPKKMGRSKAEWNF